MRRGMTDLRPTGWLIPTGLILLSLVPMLAGAVRLAELAGGAEVTPDNARFFAMPVPVVLHIVGASVYCVAGRVPVRARAAPPADSAGTAAAGRLLVPCGLDRGAVRAVDDRVLRRCRPATATSLDGVAARLRLGHGRLPSCSASPPIRRRDIARHRAWMMRGYAIGLGAGTQAFTHVPWMLLVGAPGGIARALLMAAGWVINLAVAEWVIRRRRTGHSERQAGFRTRVTEPVRTVHLGPPGRRCGTRRAGGPTRRRPLTRRPGTAWSAGSGRTRGSCCRWVRRWCWSSGSGPGPSATRSARRPRARPAGRAALPHGAGRRAGAPDRGPSTAGETGGPDQPRAVRVLSAVLRAAGGGGAALFDQPVTGP